MIHEFIWREGISITPTEPQPTPLSCYSQNLNIPRHINVAHCTTFFFGGGGRWGFEVSR